MLNEEADALENEDQLSFEDSERFDEDMSLCSYVSELDSVYNTWRGWTDSNKVRSDHLLSKPFLSLKDLAARAFASQLPFEQVDHSELPIPEEIQRSIAFWGFPEKQEDIRLYSCLSSGNSEFYVQGECLFKSRSVKDLLQIGFHLTANVSDLSDESLVHSVAVTFDRKKITSSSCTCIVGSTQNSTPSVQTVWCQHVVAVCIHRINEPKSLVLRAPVSEALGQLSKDQLQKFAQYLIYELPRQILPTAQKILDELLDQTSSMNETHGAPDPTAGSHIGDASSWCMDESKMHHNIRNLLDRFTVPSPMVYSDVNFLNSNAPPAAAEWSSLLRPLRGREPEGMWNLLAIVSEMFRRKDNNGPLLLRIATDECLNNSLIPIWWFATKISLHYGGPGGLTRNPANSPTAATQHACASLMDEIVNLWRLWAISCRMRNKERQELLEIMRKYHNNVLESAAKGNQNGARVNNVVPVYNTLKPQDVLAFSGFKPAMEACFIDWDNYKLDFSLSHSNEISLTEKNAIAAMEIADYRARKLVKRKAEDALVDAELNSNGDENKNSFNMLNRASEASNNSEATSSSRECVDDGERKASVASIVSNEDESNSFRNNNRKNNNVGRRKKGNKSDNSEPPDWFGFLQAPSDPLEVLFMRAESLYFHGCTVEAQNLAVRLARELLNSNYDLISMHASIISNEKGLSKSKRKSAQHAVSHLASSLLSKASFLLQVLEECPAFHMEAFLIGIFGLELARPPTVLKALEVKIASQEQDLAQALRKLPLNASMLEVVRRKAKELHEGTAKPRGPALLPLILAYYVFDSLSSKDSNRSNNNIFISRPHSYANEMLGFEAALAALGMKCSIAESEHPLLCESIRRQRNDLAFCLLNYYKDEEIRLARVVDCLLDKDTHCMFAEPGGPADYMLSTYIRYREKNVFNRAQNAINKQMCAAVGMNSDGKDLKAPGMPGSMHYVAKSIAPSASAPNLLLNQQNGAVLGDGISAMKISDAGGASGSGQNSARLSLVEVERNSSDDSASVKTLNGNTVDGNGSNANDAHWDAAHGSKKNQANEKNQNANGWKGGGRKSKRTPSIPNQPSEALSYSMLELARNLLAKAGGSASAAMFRVGPPNANRHGVHLGLQMCAFQIGLYGLGVHNIVTSTWNQRTYSSHVSWITGQAVEIGVAAINFLTETWEGHLTPLEVVQAADRASRSSNVSLVKAAAHLAQSALPFSHFITRHEVQRALDQCQEQSQEMFEDALKCIELATRRGNVCPEVLFDVSKRWLNLYKESCGVRNSKNGSKDASCRSCNSLDRTGKFNNNQPDPSSSSPLLPIQYAMKYNLLPTASNNSFPNSNANEIMPVNSMENVPFVAPHSAPNNCFNQMNQLMHAPVGFSSNQIMPNNNVVGQNCYFNIQHPPNLNPGPVHAAAPSPMYYVQNGMMMPNMSHAPIYANYYPNMPPPGMPMNQHNQVRMNPVLPHSMSQPHSLAQHMSAPGMSSNFNNPTPDYMNMQKNKNSLPSVASAVSQANAIFSAAEKKARGEPFTQPYQQIRIPNSFALPGASSTDRHLQAAYRVGMLAMETLSRRVHEDRFHVKYHKTKSPYSSDVLWLLERVVKKLGSDYLTQFIKASINAVASPFVLYRIACLSAHFFAVDDAQHRGVVLSSTSARRFLYTVPVMTQLMHKCMQMFQQCIIQKIHHISASEHDDFIDTVLWAQVAYHMVQNGQSQFDLLMDDIRRDPSCKAELWEKVRTAVAKMASDITPSSTSGLSQT